MTKDEILKVLNNAEFSSTGLATNLMYKTGYGSWSESSLSFNELIYELANQTIEFKIKEPSRYRPYTKDDADDFMACVIRNKNDNKLSLIIDYSDKGVYLGVEHKEYISYEELYHEYEHFSGSHCGFWEE